jgi:type III secretion protein V
MIKREMNQSIFAEHDPESSSGFFSRSSDLLLAALLVAIISLMILPLPLWVIDTLVAINIALGVMLVLMGIYITSALQFSAFPSVLLISTLFRLALSVATTRLILLHGDAGHIINTFGHMVAGGNLVVGLVVFLIITLVQFLVIAKGAERVAEVGARFTLDAMPGKQLSIDSDLRSGLIDKHEARTKRHVIELESKLHGSMDGAMKFVKGDAIAGIVIIVINLLGGLAIGIFQLNMAASAAMAKYSILTIGDGLVAQIPALLGAMAAGLIVTRSTDEQTNEHLGESIQRQFSAVPRVSLVAGGICLMLAFVPGFPSLVFASLGVALAFSGGFLLPALRSHFARLSLQRRSFEAVMNDKSAKPSSIHRSEATQVHPSVPLLLEVPRGLAAGDGDELLQAAMIECVEAVQSRSGVALPAVRFHWRAGETHEWKLHAFEVPIVEQEVTGKNAIQDIAANSEMALRRNATLFLGIQETSTLLAVANEDYPDVVKEVLRSIPVQNVAAILRYLVEEEVSIRNLRSILESLIQAAQHEKDLGNLTEFARMGLARQTCYRYASNGAMKAVVLSASLEEQLTDSVRTTGGVQQLALDPRMAERIRRQVVAAIEEHKPAALLTSVQLRRHVRSLIARECFDTPVLSYNELLPTLQLDVLHQVAADASPKLATA